MKRASKGSSKTIVAKVDAFAFTSIHDPVVGPSDDSTRTLVGYLEQMWSAHPIHSIYCLSHSWYLLHLALIVSAVMRALERKSYSR